MKTKCLKLLALLTVCLMGVAVWSCGDDDDKDTVITYETLPAQAKSFVSTYYAGVDVRSVESKTDDGVVEYEVRFQNNHEVTFDSAGLWIDVDAPAGQTIPTGIAPEPIAEYVDTRYPAVGINEISRDPRGYEVELVDGTDLLFDPAGNYIGLDR